MYETISMRWIADGADGSCRQRSRLDGSLFYLVVRRRNHCRCSKPFAGYSKHGLDCLGGDEYRWTWESADDTASHDSVIPSMDDVLRYGARAGNDQDSNRLFFRAYQMDINPVTCNEGNCIRRCFNWGLYKIAIKRKPPGLDYWTTRDSFYVDFIDENYSRYYVNGSYDFSFSYDWDDQYFIKCVPGNDSTFVSGTKVRPYDTTWIAPYPMMYPRLTKYFKPAPPAEFSISAYQSHPRLTWRSNGETFPVTYEVYRATNNRNGPYNRIAQISNSPSYPDNTFTLSFVDTDLSGAGSGKWTAYYFLKVVNSSTGSTKVSFPTDTLSINYQNLQKQFVTGGATEDHLALFQNYPNPFNLTTEISYYLPQPAEVTIWIYNSLGILVRTLMRERQVEGRHSVRWNGKADSGNEVASGVYFLLMQNNKSLLTRKMTLLK